jgi:hypothetical protein
MAVRKSIRPSVLLPTYIEQLVLEKKDFQNILYSRSFGKLWVKSHSPTNLKK